MSVYGVIKYVILLIRNPLRFVSSIFYHHPFIVGSILILGCLIKFIYKLNQKFYIGNENMTGKTVLITGASAGIGKVVAFNLAKRNARVLLACRNVEKGNEVSEEIKRATGNQNVMVECLDLSSFESVRQCAKRILEREDKLHVLINNESILGDPRKVTDDGYEIVMQTNYFGPFLLTLLLLDLLKRSSPSRIINDSFDTYFFKSFDVEDLNNERGLHQNDVYKSSKIANILFTKELSYRLQRTGVTVNSVYPDLITSEEVIGKSFLGKILFFLIGKTYEEAAQTVIYAAVDPRLGRTTGEYINNCSIMPIHSKEAQDIVLAKRLFKMSEIIVGVSFQNE